MITIGQILCQGDMFSFVAMCCPLECFLLWRHAARPRHEGMQKWFLAALATFLKTRAHAGTSAPKKIDYNEYDNATRWKCLGAINGQAEPDAIEYVKENIPLDQQTVHAGMEELHERLCGDLPVIMLPPAVCTAYALSKPEDADFISLRDSSLFILGVIWASGPEHFTLIRAEREHIGLPWKTEFWDPLDSVKTSRSAGLAVLRNLKLLPATETLPSSLPGPQKDGWSCGLHVLAKMEAWIRERRGEQPGLAVPIKEVLARLNEFLGKLKAATKPGAQSSGPAAGSPGPATEGSGAAAAASGPAAQGSCAAAQGSDPATGSSGPAAGGSGPAKRPYPDMEGDSSPQAKRSRREDEIACSSSPLSQVSLVWILWKGMTVSFC